MKRCPRCFEMSFDGEVCHKCGFESDMTRLGDALPYFTVLHDRYLVGVPLGQGGFGITYKCLDQKTNKIVVVKEYFPKFLNLERVDLAEMSPDAVGKFKHGQKRFKEEADLLMQLSRHGFQYIISAFDSFDENGTSYYVMDYIEGISLKNLSKQYRLSQEDLLSIFDKIGRELDTIHKELHLLHRDISPDNILIDAHLHPMLIDFGAAKSMDDENAFTVVLKKHYAPLEQYSKTKKQGPYTDVYALAATYYYLATGHFVLEAPERLMNGPNKPLDFHGANLPDYVKKALEKALVIKPEQRTQSVAEFLANLENKAQAHAYVRIGDKTYKVEEQGIRIGRNEDNDITLPHHQITKHHMKITYDPTLDVFVITDHSTNGTFVNGSFLSRDTIQVKAPVTINLPGILEEIKCEVEYE